MLYIAKISRAKFDIGFFYTFKVKMYPLRLPRTYCLNV